MVRSQLWQRAASSAGQKTEASTLSHTSHWIFIFCFWRYSSLFSLSCALFVCLFVLINGFWRVGVWGQKNYGRLGFRVQRDELGRSGVFSVFWLLREGSGRWTIAIYAFLFLWLNMEKASCISLIALSYITKTFHSPSELSGMVCVIYFLYCLNLASYLFK